MENQITRAIIISHDDMDGYVSAAIAWRGLMNKYGQNRHLPVQTIMVNYGNIHEKVKGLDEFQVTKNTMLVITDFSLPVETLEWFQELVGIEHIIWIDHHASSIEKYRNYGKNLPINGLRVPHGFCAAVLTYAYFFMDAFQEEHGVDKFYVYGKRQKEIISTSQEGLAFMEQHIPKALTLVDQWDTWKWVKDSEEKGRLINAGFYAIPQTFIGPIWRIFYTLDYDNDDEARLKELLKIGSYIVAYEDRRTKKIKKEVAYPAVLKGFEQYRVFAVNTDEHRFTIFSNSWWLASEYDIGVMYHFDGRKYTVSLVRIDDTKKQIDCSVIAKAFGGGGHAGAAGFITKDISVLKPNWKGDKKDNAGDKA